MTLKIATAAVAALMLAGTGAARATTSVLAQVDFSACANYNLVFDSTNPPVGLIKGNVPTSRFATVPFLLADPSVGDNVWVGAASGAIDIKVSVASPTAVGMLINSFYGQGGISNGTVIFKGTNKVQQTFNLVGNTTIRDWNNWQWTNQINGTSVQEWWTNNLNPTPQDQSHRMDAHYFPLATKFAGQTLTDIILVAPATAGINYMEPMLAAVDVEYPAPAGVEAAATSSTTLPSTCTTR